MVKPVSLATVRLRLSGRETSGRYVGHRQTMNRNSRTAIAYVDDVDNPGSVAPAIVNRNTDVLEEERSKGRISEAAFRIGRLLQSTYEARRTIRTTWATGEAVDVSVRTDHNDAALRAIRVADRIAKVESDMERTLGTVGSKLMRYFIVDRRTFDDVACSTGRASARGPGQVADRFRYDLEALTDSMMATGKDTGRIRGAIDGIERIETVRTTAELRAGRSSVTALYGKTMLSALGQENGLSGTEIIRALVLGV